MYPNYGQQGYNPNGGQYPPQMQYSGQAPGAQMPSQMHHPGQMHSIVSATQNPGSMGGARPPGSQYASQMAQSAAGQYAQYAQQMGQSAQQLQYAQQLAASAPYAAQMSAYAQAGQQYGQAQYAARMGQAPPQMMPQGAGYGQATPNAQMRPRYAFPQTQVSMEVQQWFTAVDSDQSGRINARELSGALVSGQGRQFPESVCELMIGVFSKERNGSIDVYEFQDLYNYMNGCINVFKSYDRDGSGSIDETELGQAMAQMGYRFSPDFYKVIMVRYDPTERRKITLDSFVEFSIRLQRATENFRKRDIEQRGNITLSFDEFIDAVVPTF